MFSSGLSFGIHGPLDSPNPSDADAAEEPLNDTNLDNFASLGLVLAEESSDDGGPAGEEDSEDDDESGELWVEFESFEGLLVHFSHFVSKTFKINYKLYTTVFKLRFS